MLKRSPFVRVWDELVREKSMVFMSGPRQCGKTTLAKMIAEGYENSTYLNWDVLTDKRRLIEDPYFFQDIERKDTSTPLVVLDEVHKYKGRRGYLKGAYDRFHEQYIFLVTGSGRLDLYRRGGESLAGRYRHFHLWPLTCAELHGRNRSLGQFRDDPLDVSEKNRKACQTTLECLLEFSGFPEPFLAARRTSYRRWSRSYHRQIVREDVRDLTDVKHIDDVEILFALLPSKVGAPLSVPNLATDLKVAYNTAKNWLSVLERFYLSFSITPWTARIARAIHKERKTYLFDYALVEDHGARFENLIALELFRAVNAWNDLGYGDFGLHYVRTKENREVDFLVSEGRKPMLLVEAKRSDSTPSPNLLHFQNALGVPAVQLLAAGSGFKRIQNDRETLLVVPAAWWLPNLP